MSRFLALALVAVALASSACLSYNEDCAPLVDNPDEIDGYLGGEVEITKQVVRSGDNAIGQVVADAYRHGADGVSGTAPADIGFENSGDIRNDWVCETPDSLPRGPVRRKTLRQVLPFDDTVSLITISVATLKDVLENSVAAFVDDSQGASAGGVPTGAFLQISGVTAEVDCSQPARSSATPGSGMRITRIVLGDSFLADGGDGGRVLYDGSAPASTTDTVRIAGNSYILSGGDGYTMLENQDATVANQFDLQGLNFQLVAQYFQKTYPESAPLPAQAKTRWVFTHCAGTVSP